MTTFQYSRVLATLLALFALLSLQADSRPVPQLVLSVFKAKRSTQTALLSSSPTPPLPAILSARWNEQVKRASFTKQSQRVPTQQNSLAGERRDDSHTHIHEHIHGHYDDNDYGYYHGRFRPDTYTQEEIDHHSKHWAEHHGLLSDEHDHYDHSHEHIHEHIHAHIHEDKRDGTSGEEAEEAITLPTSPALLAERGLIGDLVKPLLAPLNVIPGFITISNLLFGDGISDSGLLKKLGGLVLHVEASNASTTHHVFNFSLMASKRERTQIYLAPVQGSDDKNDSLVVKVTLPLLNSTGSPMLMCASFAVKPPSALNLEACKADRSGRAATSQFFTYTRSTGELALLLADAPSESVETAKVTARSSVEAPLADGTPADANATSLTTGATVNGTEKPAVKSSRVYMSFFPIAAVAAAPDDASETDDEVTPAKAVPAPISAAAAATSSTTDTPTDTTTDFPADRRNQVPAAVRLSRQSSSEEETDGAGAGSPSQEASESASSDTGLIQDLSGPLSSETSDEEGGGDEASRIFLAEESDGPDDSAATPAMPTKQTTQWTHHDQAPPADHCPCFAGR